MISGSLPARTPRVEPGHPRCQHSPDTSPSREFAAQPYPPSSASPCTCPQLRRDGALLHHREVTLYAVCTDDEWIFLARLALERHQPRLRVGAVVLAVIGEEHGGSHFGRDAGDSLLR